MPSGVNCQWDARQDAALRRMHRDGVFQRDMAARFGVSLGAVQRRLRKLGLISGSGPARRPITDKKEAFAEALAEVGDIEEAARIAGVGLAFAQFAFAEIRLSLGDQAI
jgi:Zn-dependent peptidase ImmA (M78 family)